MNGPERESKVSSSGDGELLENLEKTIKYQQVFLEREDQIEKALKQITSDEVYHDGDEVVDLLNIALSGIGDTDEEITQAAFGFYQLIIERRPDAADILQDLEANEKFITNILNWIIDYGTQIRRLNFRSAQGSRWWSSYDLERVLKEDGISHRHKFVIDQSEEVTIDSIPRSDWAITYSLLAEFIESYKISNNDIGYLLPPTAFNNVRRLVYQIEEIAENEGMDLPSRKEILQGSEE